MLARFGACVAFAVLALAQPAGAQDDLLAPLAPTAPAKPARKPAALPKKKPVKVAKPAPRPAAPPRPSAPPDDLLAPLRNGKGQIEFKTGALARGARVYIDEREVGALPLSSPPIVSAGERRVRVSRPGFLDFSRTVTVKPNRVVELAVSLEPVAALLTVTADVPNAQISLDGKPYGIAPKTEIVVEPGEHFITVSAPGYQDDKRRIAVRAGQEHVFSARLFKDAAPAVLTPAPLISSAAPDPIAGQLSAAPANKPLYKRWYVWAGVAVVVAAATVGVMAATSGGLPDPERDRNYCGAGPCDDWIRAVPTLP